LLYKIPRVVIAENQTFQGSEDLLQKSGITVINLDLTEAVRLMTDFIKNHPELWNEDIGV
jgi:cytosine deaminase